MMIYISITLLFVVIAIGIYWAEYNNSPSIYRSRQLLAESYNGLESRLIATQIGFNAYQKVFSMTDYRYKSGSITLATRRIV